MHLFIAGKPDQKRQRLMKEKSLTADQAALEIRRVDRDRKAYHNYYCDTKWGDARGYDLVVNSGKLGIDKTIDTLVNYVRAYQAKKRNRINHAAPRMPDIRGVFAFASRCRRKQFLTNRQRGYMMA